MLITSLMIQRAVLVWQLDCLDPQLSLDEIDRVVENAEAVIAV